MAARLTCSLAPQVSFEVTNFCTSPSVKLGTACAATEGVYKGRKVRGLEGGRGGFTLPIATVFNPLFSKNCARIKERSMASRSRSYKKTKERGFR